MREKRSLHNSAILKSLDSFFDAKIMKLAEKNDLKVIYGLEDSGDYGKTIKEHLTSRSREIREVNPLKTNRQKDFYGGDKSDEIDARCIAQILLRSYESLPTRASIFTVSHVSSRDGQILHGLSIESRTNRNTGSEVIRVSP